jgi:hypothetical protein
VTRPHIEAELAAARIADEQRAAARHRLARGTSVATRESARPKRRARGIVHVVATTLRISAH